MVNFSGAIRFAKTILLITGPSMATYSAAGFSASSTYRTDNKECVETSKDELKMMKDRVAALERDKKKPFE